MMLHKVSALETECETVLYSKQFDKLFHYQYVNCELLRNSQSELTAIWGKTEFELQPLAWKKKRFLCNHISHVPVTLTLSTPWMRAYLDIIVCKFRRNRSICLVVEAICAKSL